MIEAQPLTQISFARFGVVATAPPHGRVAPVAVLRNDRAGVPVMLGLNHLPVSPPFVTAFERHPRSGQCFVPMSGGRLLLVVAPDDPDGNPDLARVEAFVSAPMQAFDYHPGVWHAGLAALDVPGTVAALLCRDGTAADVETRTLDAPLRIAAPVLRT